MLGVESARDGAAQPMTVMFEDQDCDEGRPLIFTAKDHELTRGLRGTLEVVNNWATIERLWSPIVAEWYEGMGDPKLALVCFDAEDARIWISDLQGFLKPIQQVARPHARGRMKEKIAKVSF